MRKYNLEYVKKSFDLDNYTLVSNDRYINGRQKFDYICPNGHRHKISFCKWLEGRRCPYCDGQGKPSIEYIRSEFGNIDYILLTDKYVNVCQKLEYVCSNSHKCKISWHSWQMGRRCPYCSGKYISRESIKASFTAEDYVVMHIDYKKCESRVEYKCPVGHERSMSWRKWYYENMRCSICSYIKRHGPNHHNWKGGISCEPYCDAWADKEFKEDIKARDGYECQNPYCWGTGSRLTIHHIDYNKKNCQPFNLMTLCNSCNSRANYSREWHKEFYKNIMKSKG